MITFTPLTVTLAEISGVSQANPRAGEEDDVGDLAASLLASGQFHPLLIHQEDDGYKILDGQRRWRAIRELAREGHWAEHNPISVEMIEGDEAELREIALAANTIRRDLHPVDEHKAYASLTAAGFSEERIARDFGVGLRRVRQRLALGRLASKILDAWRAGEIDEDIARAFTAGDTHAAQEAIFEELTASDRNVSGRDVRKALRSDALDGAAKEAVYVGAEAYLAAGGRLHEDLFEEGLVFRDGALLKKLARVKLIAAADAIAEAEGWGFVLAHEDAADGDYVDEAAYPDYLDDEQTAIDEYEAADTTDPGWAALRAEREEIEARAILRAIPQARRAALGLVYCLEEDGVPRFDRGWEQTPAVLATAADDEDEDAPAPAARPKSAAAPEPAAKQASPSKALRAVLDEAVAMAFARCIEIRPDIAIMFAIAKLGTQYSDPCANVFKIGISGVAPELESALLKELGEHPFARALEIATSAPLADLTVALAEIISGWVRVPAELPLADLTPIARALSARGAPLAKALDAALDREAYFEAATRAACLDALDEMGTELVDRQAKKPVLAAQAAADAAKKKWLPKPLSEWAAFARRPETPSDFLPEPEVPLAEAMVAAIDADEAAEVEEWERKIYRVVDFQRQLPRLAQFLKAHVARDDESKVKAGDLYAALVSWSEIIGQCPPISMITLGAILADLGIAKKRFSNGVHYLGLALREDAKEQAA